MQLIKKKKNVVNHVPQRAKIGSGGCAIPRVLSLKDLVRDGV